MTAGRGYGEIRPAACLSGIDLVHNKVAGPDRLWMMSTRTAKQRQKKNETEKSFHVVIFSLVFVYELIPKVLNPFRNQSCFQKGICFHRDTDLLWQNNTRR